MAVVSVIVSARNAAKYVEKALSSVTSQTLRDLEVLVVDDGSCDDTAERVARVAAQDERVHLISLSSQRGLGATRNAALAEAKGDWIAILETDDWYAPDRLEHLLATAEAAQADVVVDNCTFIKEGANLGLSATLFSAKGPDVFFVTAADYLRSCEPGKAFTMSVLKPMFRRELLETHDLRYREGLTHVQDHDFLLRCLAVTGGFQVSRAPTYYRLVRRQAQEAGRNWDEAAALRQSYGGLLPLYRHDRRAARQIRRQQRQLARSLRLREIFTPARRRKLRNALGMVFQLPSRLRQRLGSRAA